MVDTLTVMGGLYQAVSLLAAALVPLALVEKKSSGAPSLRLPIMVTIALSAWYGIAMTVGAAGGIQTSLGAVPAALVALFTPIIIGLGAVRLVPALGQALASPEARPKLIAMQTYRLLGPMFLVLVALDQMPAVFAIPAGLGDFITGLFALSTAAAVRNGNLNRGIWWNAFGLIDLAVALTIAVGTGPGPLHFIPATSSRLFTTAPFMLVPAFIVPLDIWLHIVSLRSLLLAGAASRTAKRVSQPAAA